MKQQVETVKWYRVPMVFVMIGLPFIAVVASLTTVVIAYQNAPQVISASSPNSNSAPGDSNH
ncbi:MAG: hypothetical protein P8I38_15700 [Arenicella sp.]|jgi:hypothetical protein|nr:hypothetical protein [Arenicella sp.]